MGLFKSLFGAVLGTAVTIGLGLATGGLSWATLTWATVARTFAVNMVLGFIGSALAPKPPSQELKDNTITRREPVASRKLIYGKTRVGGTIVFMDSTGDKNEYLHLVITLASHACQSVDEVYFNDEMVWNGTVDADWADFVEVTAHLGSTTQTADANLVSRITDWTTNHRLQGVTYLYVRLKYDQDKFAMGIPNISAVVQGKTITGVVHSGYTNNPADCIYDYLTDSNYGMGIDPTEIDNGSFVAAANVCDETVALAAGGSQARYTLDGLVDLANSRSQVIEDMLTSMGGVLTYSGGKFYLFASKYYTPTITFDESNIIGAIQIQTKPSRRELYNGVKGVFSSVEDNYTLVDYPPVISSTYSAEDGEPIYLDLNLPYTNNPARAQRLAKLILLQGRQQISATIPCNLSALKVKAGDFIKITNARMGWSEKVFRVTGYELNVTSGDVLGVNLNVIETSSAIYDWNTSDETDFVAGTATNLPAFYFVKPPTNLQKTAGSLIFTDGTAMSYIDVTWDNNDAYAHQYELQYKLGTGDFTSVITSNTYYRLENVTAGGSYTIQVRAINRLGARSVWVSGTLLGVADLTAPDAPSSISIDSGFRYISLSWTNPSVADLRQIEIWESDDSNVANAQLIALTAGTSFIRNNLGIDDTKYYFLRSVDFTGNKSAYTSEVHATSTGVEDPDFANGIYSLFQDQGLYALRDVASLPASGAFDGEKVYLTSDGKIYAWDDTGSTWDAVVGDIEDLSVTSAKVAESAIITSKLATNAITETKISDNAITSGKISANAVIAGKIAANAVTATQIAADSVTSAKIAAGAVTATEIAGSTITGNKIVANTITGGLLATSGIITSSAQINDAVVTNAKIGNAAVDTLKIAGQAVTIPTSTYSTGNVNLPTSFGGSVNVATMTFTSTGSPAFITLSLAFYTGSSSLGVTVQIYRGATKIYEAGNRNFSSASYDCTTICFKDTPGSGSVTYTAKCVATQSMSGAYAYNRAFSALEVKR